MCYYYYYYYYPSHVSSNPTNQHNINHIGDLYDYKSYKDANFGLTCQLRPDCDKNAVDGEQVIACVAVSFMSPHPRDLDLRPPRRRHSSTSGLPAVIVTSSATRNSAEGLQRQLRST